MSHGGAPLSPLPALCAIGPPGAPGRGVGGSVVPSKRAPRHTLAVPSTRLQVRSVSQPEKTIVILPLAWRGGRGHSSRTARGCRRRCRRSGRPSCCCSSGAGCAASPSTGCRTSSCSCARGSRNVSGHGACRPPDARRRTLRSCAIRREPRAVAGAAAPGRASAAVGVPAVRACVGRRAGGPPVPPRGLR